jgi:hypothetical protein
VLNFTRVAAPEAATNLPAAAALLGMALLSAAHRRSACGSAKCINGAAMRNCSWEQRAAACAGCSGEGRLCLQDSCGGCKPVCVDFSASLAALGRPAGFQKLVEDAADDA